MDRIFDNLDLDISVYAPNRPGVYAVYFVDDWWKPDRKERLVYIGSSTNIKKRLQSNGHPYSKMLVKKERNKTDIGVFCKFIQCDNFKEMEMELIKTYRPFLNKTFKNRGKKIYG